MTGKENDSHVSYETVEQVLFSPMLPTKNGFALKWMEWKPYYLFIGTDAILSYKAESSSPLQSTKFSLKKVSITEIRTFTPAENDVISSQSAHSKDIAAEVADKGIIVKCSTLDGFESYFRVIFSTTELARFRMAVMAVSDEVTFTENNSRSTAHSRSIHNNSNNGNDDTNQAQDSSSTGRRNPVLKTALSLFQLPRTASSSGILRNRRKSSAPRLLAGQSVMRSTIAHQMDRYDLRSKQDRIVSRRGEFRWLPALMANDLVHGAWWFVVGSILFVGSSLIMLLNTVPESRVDLGSDDSGLGPDAYRATWVLMLVSGVFSTLGSLGFVRAVHEDPPMKPLFASLYHLQNDELLGSWLFLLACLPLIPYCLIYLANENYHSLVYLGALLVSLLIIAGNVLFVLACYPNSDKARRKVLRPIARVACWLCCTRKWLRRHMANDWLAGTWLVLWGSLAATAACAVLLVAALAKRDTLKIFLIGTTFLENFCFLLGSTYFVAGSYPESALTADFLSAGGGGGDSDDDSDSDSGGEEDGGDNDHNNSQDRRLGSCGSGDCMLGDADDDSDELGDSSNNDNGRGGRVNGGGCGDADDLEAGNVSGRRYGGGGGDGGSQSRRYYNINGDNNDNSHSRIRSSSRSVELVSSSANNSSSANISSRNPQQQQQQHQQHQQESTETSSGLGPVAGTRNPLFHSGVKAAAAAAAAAAV